jgi:hypothetical protein
MKKLWLHIILAVLISIGWTVCSQAIDLVPVTSFDSSWTTFTSGTATTTLSIDGAKVNLSAQGSATDSGDKELYQPNADSRTIGMYATLRVDQAASDSNLSSEFLGINAYIGRVDNNRIQFK